MKKEKIKLTEEEKMVNNFKFYNVVIVIAQGVIIALFTILAIASVVTLFESDFDLEAVKQVALEMLDYDGEISEIAYLIKLIAFYIVLECLARIMKDTYKNKTPFLKQNINRIYIISIFVIIYSNILIFIILEAVAELFKYGYKLQKETDKIENSIVG